MFQEFGDSSTYLRLSNFFGMKSVSRSDGSASSHLACRVGWSNGYGRADWWWYLHDAETRERERARKREREREREGAKD